MAIKFEDSAPRVSVNPKDQNKIVIQEVNNEVKISASGPQGIQGPTGPAGEGTTPAEVVAMTSYTHNQIASSTTWTIAHNLGFYPNATVFDSASTQIEAEIVHNDNNSLTITFSASMSGKAYLS